MSDPMTAEEALREAIKPYPMTAAYSIVQIIDHLASLGYALHPIKIDEAAVEKAAKDYVMVDNPFYIFEPHIAVKRLFERIRARLTAPPAKPTKQEIVVAVLGQYVFQTQDLGFEELANEIVVRLDAADKEKCDG